MEEVMRGLGADNHALALEIARLPETIRGYGHVKERSVVATRERWQGLLQRWRAPAQPLVQATPDRARA